MMMESSINSATILPPYEEFEPVDNLHWSPETANSIYLFWIHQLQVSSDKVLIRQTKKNIFSTAYNPKPYTVIAVKGSMIMAKRHEHCITRNSSYFKIIPNNVSISYEEGIEFNNDNPNPMIHPPDNLPEPQIAQSRFVGPVKVEILKGQIAIHPTNLSLRNS
ncbi:hypothetical protein LOTGIDRAFT_160059 [Lottia gigantea]|uniref:Uncharacterized protein n=1 Tax=Lottia gigantea TaxID=225164 RepID=V4C3G4_LOTGI|nr:hypothetical protein LOTGIDRAFT_160059 [Lottia gigantea]ESO96074.1 hypothetical protein LOTGIDRAFT_160059 [Lottia gigantea]